MLTAYDQGTANPTRTVPPSGTSTTNDAATTQSASTAGKSRLARALNVEWLGQTVASLCWIASVFTYGISATGDWLQLCAASAWLLANMASIATVESDERSADSP